MPRKHRIAVKKQARGAPRPGLAERGAPAPQVREKPGPRSTVEVDLVSPDGVGVPEPIVTELLRTRVWVIIASVLFFLGTLGNLTSMTFAIVAFVRSGGAEASQGAVTDTGVVSALTAIIYLFAAIVMVTIALRMVFFANRIGSLERSGGEGDLEFVLAYLKGFWSMLGGGTLTLLVSVILLIGLRFLGS